MIIPLIRLLDGKAVSASGGVQADASDPMALAERYAVAGDIAIIDGDAAAGRRDNGAIVAELVRKYPCRVGGGIRDERSALRWLDRGARKIFIDAGAGSARFGALPRDRVVAALDADATAIGTVKALVPQVSGFAVKLAGIGPDLDLAEAIARAAGDRRVAFSGGIDTMETIEKLDRIGADAVVNSALLSGKLRLADAIVAPLRSDRPDGLFATVVTDAGGQALGLAWSDLESLRDAVENRRGTYHSRSRGLWVKGLSSGNTQRLLGVSLDCDRDALRFVVAQEGDGFCHNGTWSCWGDDWGLARLLRQLRARLVDGPEGSYTKKLFDHPDLLRSKLLEEAGELAEAHTREEAVHEAADLLYFALTAMARAGVDLTAVERELLARSLRVTRGERDQETG